MRTTHPTTIGIHLTGSKIEEQLQLERASVREGIIRYREMVRVAHKRGEATSLKPVERWMVHWFPSLVAAIESDQKRYKKNMNRFTPEGRKQEDTADRVGYTTWGPPLMLLGADVLAVITMNEILRATLADQGGVKFATVSYAIGRAVLAEAQFDTLVKTQDEGWKKLNKRLSKATVGSVNRYANKTLSNDRWSMSVSTQLGGRLAWHLIITAAAGGYKNFKNAFVYETRRDRKKTVRWLRLRGTVMEEIEKSHQMREVMRPLHRPMVVTPLPWGPKHDGGYLRVRTPLVYRPTVEHKRLLKNAVMPSVFTAINWLSETPWEVNADVYDVQAERWRGGGGVLGIPPSCDIATPPRDERSPELLKASQRRRSETYRKNVGLRGVRHQYLNFISEAEDFKSRGMFTLPHNLDFRGRAYPKPSSLNHHRDDTIRGSMRFHECHEPDEDGERWLKIHAANCYGIDKVSLDARASWTENHMEEIEQCATAPESSTFWHHADGGSKPWQFLAACKGLRCRNSGGRLPVSIDGTCNVMQHYSALGRDQEGAELVNMVKLDRPNDIYTDVARVTADQVADDAKNSTAWLEFKKADGTVVQHEVAEIAGLFDGEIDRKVCKPPVMTKLYGVTYVGARKQVYHALEKKDFQYGGRYRASMYLSRIILDSMKKVAPVAMKIMEYLTTLATITAKAGRPMRWTSPLGFPIIQSYRKLDSFNVVTVAQTISVGYSDSKLPIKKGKQVTAFPANYIHHIDAAHLMMVAEAMKELRRRLATVHDSFWTFANYVSLLSQICREQFVRLHRMNLLQMLVDELRKHNPDLEYPDPPERGTYSINDVYDAELMFS